MAERKTHHRHPTIEEIVVASGLHQQKSPTTKGEVANPTIEEIVVASGLHQQKSPGA